MRPHRHPRLLQQNSLLRLAIRILDRNPWCRGIGFARHLHVHVFEHVVAELVPLLINQVARAVSRMDTCEAVGLNVEVWPCRAVAEPARRYPPNHRESVGNGIFNRRTATGIVHPENLGSIDTA